MRIAERHDEVMEDADGQVSIDPIRAEHEEQWRDLWRQYLDFYGTELPEPVTARAWQNMLKNENFIGFAAVRATKLVGFAVVILHEASWSIGRSAYLEDLFVRTDERGHGIGRKLIDEVIRRAQFEGWATVYWHTQASNAAARKLYDSYCEADNFVRYRLTIDDRGPTRHS